MAHERQKQHLLAASHAHVHNWPGRYHANDDAINTLSRAYNSPSRFFIIEPLLQRKSDKQHGPARQYLSRRHHIDVTSETSYTVNLENFVVEIFS